MGIIPGSAHCNIDKARLGWHHAYVLAFSVELKQASTIAGIGKPVGALSDAVDFPDAPLYFRASHRVTKLVHELAVEVNRHVVVVGKDLAHSFPVGLPMRHGSIRAGGSIWRREIRLNWRASMLNLLAWLTRT